MKIRHHAQRCTAAGLLAAASALAVLPASAPQAVADPTYQTGTGAIPSGPNQGEPEVGPGARITNKAFGYYIGRALPGAHLTPTAARVRHTFGRITGPSLDLCGWLYDPAIGRRVDAQANGCTRADADRMWQRTTFGRKFSTPAHTRGGRTTATYVPVKAGCQLYYNYFLDPSFRHGRLRDPAPGPIGTRSRQPGKIVYRYRTIDDRAVVVSDEVQGWGFLPRGCVRLRGVTTYPDRDEGRRPRLRRPGGDSTELPSQRQATTSQAPLPGAITGPASQADCHWRVTWPTAGVYELPTRQQGPIKTKNAGDVVGPYCTTYYNAGEGEEYVMVHTLDAADDIGWMRRNALVRT